MSIRTQLATGLHFLATRLTDPHGRAVTVPSRPVMDAIGYMRVQDAWHSGPSVGLTPAKLALILRDADQGNLVRQSELAEEIEEKSPQIASTLQTRKLAIQELAWDVQPASDSAQDGRIAELVQQQLTDLDLTSSVYEFMDAPFKGFAALEIHWRRQQGQAWVVGLDRIPQQRFTFNFSDLFPDAPLPKLPRLLTTSEPFRGIDLPPFKVIFHQSSARSGLPQRSGLFRTLVWSYLFWNFSIKDWMIFMEKYGHPLRLGKITPAAQPPDIEILKAAVQSLGSDAGAVISDSTMLEIIQAQGTAASLDLYERSAKYFDALVAKVVLGQTASTEGTPGNLGSEQERSAVRQDIKKADARSLAKTIRDQLVWPLVGFNFGWDHPLPHFQFVIEEPEDLASLAQTHKTLVEMGTPIPLSFIQQTYGIPEAVGDEPVLQQVAAPLAFAVLDAKKKVPLGSRWAPSLPSPASPTVSSTRQTD